MTLTTPEIASKKKQRTNDVHHINAIQAAKQHTAVADDLGPSEDLEKPWFDRCVIFANDSLSGLRSLCAEEILTLGI